MNEYRFRGTRKSDGAPVESRMLAKDQKQLELQLFDYGIVLESAELVDSHARNQTVSLGCGTLILIALIVMFFSRGSNDELRQELRQLQLEVQLLRKTIEAR